MKDMAYTLWPDSVAEAAGSEKHIPAWTIVRFHHSGPQRK